MAYQEITDTIVESYNLTLDNKEPTYQFNFIGYIAEDNKGNSFIVEGNCPTYDISIESNETDWINITIPSNISPNYILLDITDMHKNLAYAKIYLKYNNYITDNYIYITNYVNRIVLYNRDLKSFIFILPLQLNIVDYPLSKYYPIGIEVIPSSHNVYGNGKAGIMSLKLMSCKTPDDGSLTYLDYFDPVDYTDSVLYWGPYNNLVFTLYLGVPCILNDETCTIRDISTNSIYLPIDKFSEINCIHDNYSYYIVNISNNFVPSPFLNNGSRNSKYYLLYPDTDYPNPLSDFNSKNDTNILCNLATAQSNWKTASTITNSYDSGYFPAACCCWRYHTIGTNQGDWYFPSIGELGYLVVRKYTINNSINKIILVYGNSYTTKLYDFLLSITEAPTTASDLIYRINLYDYDNNKYDTTFESRILLGYKSNNPGYVRSFILI